MRIFALTLFSFLLAGAVGAREPATETRARVEEVVFESGEIQLAGRLWLPVEGGPHPAVVFIPGSGRSIRDLQLDPDPVPFHFTREGVAFLAWDKRGVRDSEGVFEPLDDSDPRAQLARLRLLATDASAAMSYLAGRQDIDPHRIGVSAFSQGGWVASLLETAGGEPRFVIVVGGPAVSVGEEGAYSEFADAARQASRDGERPVEMDEVYRDFEGARLREGDFGGYDPVPQLEDMNAPILFLLGEYDLSVPTRRSAARLEELGTRREHIDYRVFDRANHGVATVDAAGRWHMAEHFYETQFDFLRNLGIIDAKIRTDIAIDEDRGVRIEVAIDRGSP